MEFGRSVLSPSYSRIPDYKNYGSLNNRWDVAHRFTNYFNRGFKFRCVNCDGRIAASYQLLIQETFGWAERFGDDAANKAKEFYEIETPNDSQRGGFPSMIREVCTKCETKYVIYARVDEIYNSVFHVTLQGITEIIEEAN